MELAGLRFAMHNLGCKVNSYETEAMTEAILQEGARLVDFTEEADIYLINTCSVTNIADRKSRQMIHQAKQRNPEAIVIATGCYVEGKQEELKEDKGIDILIGNTGKGRVVELIKAYREAMLENDASPMEPFSPVREEGEYENLFLSKPKDKSRAFVKVQDGCNQFCAYCIIPYVRGRIRRKRTVWRRFAIWQRKAFKKWSLPVFTCPPTDWILKIFPMNMPVERRKRERLYSI